MMRRLTSWNCLMAVLLAVSGCSQSTGLGHGKGKTLVTIDGEAITEGDLDFLTTINPRLKGQIATPFGQKQIVENLVEQTLLYHESARRGLDHDPNVHAKIDLYRRVIIAQAALDDAMEKAAKEYYDAHAEEFSKLELSHILIRFKQADAKGAKASEAANRSEEQALQLATAVRQRLDKGEDFAEVAKQVSEDIGSKNTGGLLGRVWKQEPRLERRGYGPLLEKAFAMKVGAVEGPVKTQEGFHLLLVTKGIETQSFEEAKQSIFFKVQGDLRTKFLAELKEKAKIAYAEGLGEPKQPAPAPSGEAPPAAAAPGAEAAPVKPPSAESAKAPESPAATTPAPSEAPRPAGPTAPTETAQPPKK